MKLRNHLTVLAAVLLAMTAAVPAGAAIRTDYDERLSAAERQQVDAWLKTVSRALEELVGPFDFDVYVEVRRTRASEPVPWANTRRARRQGIVFHIDPRYPASRFLDDWTAPHEFSHLVLPYVGRESSWFAEGFASFMQYQVMHQMGVLSARDSVRRYRERLSQARRAYPDDNRNFVELAARLRAQRRYRTLYWGGAAFFLQVDHQLREQHDTTLVAVLRDYLACCRQSRSSVAELVTTLDTVSGTSVFSNTLVSFRREPGFPDAPEITPRLLGR